MSKLQPKRLLKLADFLENSKTEAKKLGVKGTVKFDMNVYLRNNNDEGYYEPYAKAKCGTTCCAMGFASIHPWFAKEGLRIKGVVFKPAGMKFFGLNNDDYDHLFHNSAGTTRQMAKVLRGFVEIKQLNEQIVTLENRRDRLATDTGYYLYVEG